MPLRELPPPSRRPLPERRTERRESRRPRRPLTLLASLALAGASTFAGGAAATAAPDDPVVFADQGLEDAVNEALGQSAGETITENQAAGISAVDADSRSITDLSGIEYLTGLEMITVDDNEISDLSSLSGLTGLNTLSVNNNNISDLSALTSLTSLASLEMYGNTVASVSALQDLTNLQYVNLSDNEITDISALSGLTDLLYLVIGGNSIADLSPLSGLAGLQMVEATGQSIGMSSTPAGIATANPLLDIAGASVPVSSTNADFAYDAASQAWTFTTRGNKSMTWTIPLMVGTADVGEFSGTISQRISPTQATPVDPEVIPAACLDGDVTAPQIILPDTEGIVYTISGDVVPGATVTIEATLADDEHAIYVDPASDWVDVASDHFYATLEITLTSPDCEPELPTPTLIDPPNGDLPTLDPCGPDNATWVLPTGDDVPEGFSWVVDDDGLLTAVAHDGYVFSAAGASADQTMREYGYAPDANEPCQTSTDEISADDPGEDSTLAVTGSAAAAGGAVAAALLGAGGLLLLLARQRRTESLPGV